MKKISVIPIIKDAFSCVFHHPAVLFPFLLYYGLCGLVLVWIFQRFDHFLTITNTAYPPFEEIISMMNFIFAVIGLMILLLFLFPLVEGWTFAILKNAYRNEPIDMRGTLKRGIRRYPGMVVITFILLIASSVASLVATPLLFVSMMSAIPESMPAQGEPFYQPSTFMFPEIFIIYGIMFIIMLLIYTVFIYLKPVYIMGDDSLSQSLKDGIAMGKNQYIPTFLLVLFFMVIQVAIFVIGMTLPVLANIIDMDILTQLEGPSLFFQSAIPLIIIGLIAYLISVVIHAIMYAAIARAYLDVQETIFEQ